MTFDINELYSGSKTIKISSDLHKELSILKAKWDLPKLECVIKELLAKRREDEKIQDSDRQ